MHELQVNQIELEMQNDELRRSRAEVEVWLERYTDRSNDNRDLEKEVRKGRFRQDLYYRLNVFPITVPQLRQRKEDIPLLVQTYIELYARKLGKQIMSVQKKTIKTLQEYPWPGNVRELESVLERAVILCSGPALQLAAKLDISSLPMSSATRTLKEVERNQIRKILSETR